MNVDDLKKKQAELEKKRKAEGEDINNPFASVIDSWRVKADKAREAMKRERAGQNITPKPAPTKKGPILNTDNDKKNINKNGDMSISEIRMENFKTANSRLSASKSQLPNLVVQSKIFPATKKGRRPIFDWKEIHTGRKDVEIWQRGEQLNQLDLTGWLMLIKFTKGPDLIAEFTRYEFLKAMKKHDSSRDYNWLRGLLSRLNFAQFNILYLHNNKKWSRYEGSLAPQNYETSEGKFAVQLSKPLYAMFGFDGWSYVDMEQRLALGQNQWAQAFHAWASTHTCPKKGFWFKKEDLFVEWGAGYKTKKDFLPKFKSRILKPLYELEFIKKVVEKDSAIGLWW